MDKGDSMRFHCLGIPHTVTSKEYVPCAFTQKVLNFCEMMTKLGHSVFHYGNEASEVYCTEHVSVTTLADLDETYKDKPEGRNYWKAGQFEHSMDSHVYKRFFDNTIRELRARAQADDFVLAFWGLGHLPVCNAVGDLPVHVVEPGIGYPTTFAKYRVFESYAKLHLVKGQLDEAFTREKVGEPYTHPNWMDEVIPNYFNPDDFEYREDKDEYLLFIGRITASKGIEIAMRLADHFNLPLKVAGQGDFVSEMGWTPYDCVELLGSVGVEERKALMARAKAGICASWYIEPFCGTHIEFGLSGTPVLTTDWGVFTETVEQGRNGWRCRSFEEFVQGLDRIDEIQPAVCREMAMNYSMDRVALMYHDYFERLLHQIHQESFWELERVGNLDTRRRDVPMEEVARQREGLVPRTLDGKQYHPGGSIKGGDAWLTEERVWEYCYDLGVRSVLDIGAGEGHAAKYFSELGCQVVAVDMDMSAIENAVFPVVYHDIAQGPLYGGRVDLVYMAEFVEHLQAHHLPQLAKSIEAYKADKVLMTYAPPGHEGIGHVNCQNEAYWVEWMAGCGFELNEGYTRIVRDLAEHPHFSERGLLFWRT